MGARETLIRAGKKHKPQSTQGCTEDLRDLIRASLVCLLSLECEGETPSRQPAGCRGYIARAIFRPWRRLAIRKSCSRPCRLTLVQRRVRDEASFQVRCGWGCRCRRYSPAIRWDLLPA